MQIQFGSPAICARPLTPGSVRNRVEAGRRDAAGDLIRKLDVTLVAAMAPVVALSYA